MDNQVRPNRWIRHVAVPILTHCSHFRFLFKRQVLKNDFQTNIRQIFPVPNISFLLLSNFLLRSIFFSLQPKSFLAHFFCLFQFSFDNIIGLFEPISFCCRGRRRGQIQGLFGRCSKIASRSGIGIFIPIFLLRWLLNFSVLKKKRKLVKFNEIQWTKYLSNPRVGN